MEAAGLDGGKKSLKDAEELVIHLVSRFRLFGILDAVEMQNRKTHQSFIKFHQIHQSKLEKEKNQLNEANRIRFVAVDFKKSDIQMTFRIFKW